MAEEFLILNLENLFFGNNINSFRNCREFINYPCNGEKWKVR